MLTLSGANTLRPNNDRLKFQKHKIPTSTESGANTLRPNNDRLKFQNYGIKLAASQKLICKDTKYLLALNLVLTLPPYNNRATPKCDPDKPMTAGQSFNESQCKNCSIVYDTRAE